MKILLIGSLGKMGKTIAESVSNTDDEIVAGIDITSVYENGFETYDTIPKALAHIDAIIDFSTAQSRQKLIEFAHHNKIPYGLFSTVISKQDEEGLKNLSKSVPVLKCKNSSLGINLFYLILKEICPKLKTADAVLTEYHHKQKLDSPSGTAKEIERILISNGVKFSTSAFRVGNEKGFHKLQFFFGDEILEISHRANSRKVFADGALDAMHKLLSKPAGLYESILDL